MDVHQLEHAPEAVGHVEPQGYESHQVAYGSPEIAESCLQEHGTHSGVGGSSGEVNSSHSGDLRRNDFGELHLSPELPQVEQQEGDDYEAEHKHVLGGPFDLSGTRGDGVAIVAASTTVLQRQPQCIHDVDDKQCGQADGSDQGIPVGAEKFAHGIVSRGPQQRYRVHQHVKGYE